MYILLLNQWLTGDALSTLDECRTPSGPRRGDTVVSYATPRPVAPLKGAPLQPTLGLQTPPTSAPRPLRVGLRSAPRPASPVASTSEQPMDVDTLYPIAEEEVTESGTFLPAAAPGPSLPVASPGPSTPKSRAQAKGKKAPSPSPRKSAQVSSLWRPSFGPC